MTTQATPAASSALLLAANEKLLALRRERGISGQWPETGESLTAATGATADHRPPTAAGVGTAQAARVPLLPCSPALLPAVLDGRLGWGSDRLTEQLRRHAAKPSPSVGAGLRPAPTTAAPAPTATQTGAYQPPTDYRPPTTDGRPPAVSPLATRHSPLANSPSPLVTSHSPLVTIPLHPDLALGMLRQGQAAAGRVWLLLRAADPLGRGAIGEDEALRLLSASGSPYRICARRQAKNLLLAGEGVFWERGDGRLWLRSTARVAAALGVERLSGAPVAAPLEGLTAGMGAVRAHLYAAFHSGRTKERPSRGGRRGPVSLPASSGAPIARQTLERLSHACPNSQRAYEKRAGVSARPSYAVGPAHNGTEAQEQAWQRGRAVFTLVDRAGRYGRPGGRYIAWQLPNEYTGPHARLPRGRLKRINRRIAGLLDNGMTGNGVPASDARARQQRKRFFGDGAAAAAAERRLPAGAELYWRGPGQMWHWWKMEEEKPQITQITQIKRGDLQNSQMAQHEWRSSRPPVTLCQFVTTGEPLPLNLESLRPSAKSEDDSLLCGPSENLCESVKSVVNSSAW